VIFSDERASFKLFNCPNNNNMIPGSGTYTYMQFISGHHRHALDPVCDIPLCKLAS
jgi:hypothetical protein